MSCAVASSVTRRKIFINFFLLSPQRSTTERDHTLVHHKDFLKWLRSERRAVKCCTSSKSALMQKNTHCRRRAKKSIPMQSTSLRTIIHYHWKKKRVISGMFHFFYSRFHCSNAQVLHEPAEACDSNLVLCDMVMIKVFWMCNVAQS